ncbi:MAG: SDR family oxidoreductase [Actinobacteria bacterium]|jgi:NAD(P)-dependent dehydrogenase (short-subunit alcohol dehydrogenase family)|nr:MAG: SDR family oxidoreductase [Actinomycetota bacterium]
MKLRGMVAVVTGGGRGIGRAICLAYAEEGADLVVASDVAAENAAVAAEVGSLGREALPYAVDVSVESQVNEMAEAALSRFGKVDILVSNAGINRRGLLIHSDSDDWKKTVEVMVYGTYHCCKAFVPGMVERDNGRVIVMSSIMGKQANPANSSYAASKHALIGITRTLAAEVAMMGARGVTVNAICPGIANTEMVTGSEGTIARLSEMLGMSREEVWEQLLKKMSLQERLIEPEEIAAMAVYLASREARGITGQAINVCGGANMC